MSQFCFNQKGSIFVLMAFTIPFLFALSAIAVDGGYLYVQRSHMQNIADAAALAGAAKLGTSTNEAKLLAETYIANNSTAADASNNNIITFTEENNLKKIRVHIAKAAPLLFMKYFNFNTVDLAVQAVASYSGSTPSIFDYNIISGGKDTFYLNGQYGSGSNTFKGLIHTNGRFEFDTTGSGSLNNVRIENNITISIPEYSINGLNNRKDLEKYFRFGADEINITETNPVIKAKIDALTNKANTFSSSHPASVRNDAIDAFQLLQPLYVNGHLTDGSGNPRSLIPRPDYSGGVVNHNITIVATGDIKLRFSSITISNNAVITLVSENGNIFIEGGNMINLNALAPHGKITVNGGGTTIDGYLIGQIIELGQGNRTYQNSRGTGGSGGSNGGVKIRLIE